LVGETRRDDGGGRGKEAVAVEEELEGEAEELEEAEVEEADEGCMGAWGRAAGLGSRGPRSAPRHFSYHGTARQSS